MKILKNRKWGIRNKRRIIENKKKKIKERKRDNGKKKKKEKENIGKIENNGKRKYIIIKL